MHFYYDTTIKEMILSFFSEMKISKKYQKLFNFIYNAESLNINDEGSLFEKGMNDNSEIKIISLKNVLDKNHEGKILKVTI